MCLDTSQLLDRIRTGRIVPFSFTLGGTSPELKVDHVRENAGPDRSFITVVYADPDLPLRVRLHATRVEALDLLTFHFTLQADAAVSQCVDDVRLLDLELTGQALEGLSVRRFHGGWSKYEHHKFPQDEFGMHDLPLTEPVAHEWSEPEGRASRDNLPIWILNRPDRGLWFGPEFGGMWGCEVERTSDAARVRLGLPQMHFAMRAGEEIEMPAVSLGSYTGDVWEGCLHLRRTIRDEFLPKLDGELMTPPVVYQILTGDAQELKRDGLRRDVDLAGELGIEAYVWASPWYRNSPPTSMWDNPDWYVLDNPITGEKDWANWWENCGDFVPKEDRFDRGFDDHVKQLSDHGIRLGLWYDPRISTYVEEHKRCADVLLPYKQNAQRERDKIWNMGLIDLSRPSGRRYMLDLLERFIGEYGARWVWHDLNVEVRPRYFEPAEAEDRKGLTELAYHQGKHMVYDELLRRHPDVVIEWCASGGTMIDLGTLRRVHTIWVTDYTEMYPWQGEKYNTDCTRITRSRLNWIFPACLIMNTIYAPEQVLHSETNAIGMDNMLTQMGSLFGIGQSLIRWKQEDLDSAKAAIGVYKRVRGYLNKEFRGLLPIPETQDVWDAWQFHDPQTGGGVMMFYKLVDCDRDAQSVQPHWMQPGDEMHFDVLLGQATLNRDGADLTVNMSSGAAIVEYRIG